MNRYGWFIAAAYVGLAVVSAGVYLATTSKWVDYSETQLRFESTRSAYVASANVTPFGGGRAIELRWRFENPGRLPITIAIFQFQLYADNGSDPREWNDPGKLATEFTRPLSFNLDRLTGLAVPASSTADWTWRVNVTTPEDVARVQPHAADGKYYLAFVETRIIYYISDINNRQTRALDSFILGVGP